MNSRIESLLFVRRIHFPQYYNRRFYFLSNLSGQLSIYDMDFVNEQRADGKEIELMVFENESHDIPKYQNRKTCYNKIEDIIAAHSAP